MSNQTPPKHDEPLGLTVHSMPSPGSGEGAVVNARLGRIKMLLVLLVCVAPVVASYLTYYVLRPEGRRNYGELIEPQRPVPSMPALSLQGTAGNLQQLKGNWLLISVASAACDLACEKHLYLQRQLRESLGKEKERLDWVWLVTDDAPIKPELLPALAKAKVLRVKPEQLAQWLQPAVGESLSNHLYVVDPLGNWMMRFPAALDASKAKRDLDRLMRGSAFWHKPQG
jgi:hypothetical protein